MVSDKAAHGVAMLWGLAKFIGCGLLAALSVPATAQVVVNDSGQPSYRYAIKVPPGVGGFAPEVSLVYDGTSTGVLGKGWRIEGIPAIARCQPTRSVDGANGIVKFGANDKLCLNGERLIQTSADGNPLPFPQTGDAGAGGEYRTERDKLVRVRSYGQAVQPDGYTPYDGPSYFKVWTRDGRVQTLKAVLSPPLVGANVSTPSGGKALVAWPFVTETDKAGNLINYVSNGWGQFFAPRTVGYNGAAPNSEYSMYPQDNASIVFNYDMLPNHLVQRAYYRGSLNVLSQQLSSIDIKATPNSIARRIFLTYSASPYARANRLTSIKECVGVSFNQCLPPTTFAYSYGGGTYTAQAGMMPYGALADEALMGDFNGDGRTDILLPSPSSAPSLSLSTTGGGYSNHTVSNGSSIQASRTPLVADFDGDGLDDVFVSEVWVGWEECGTSGICSLIFRSNGDGTFSIQVVRFSGGSAIPLRRSSGAITVVPYHVDSGRATVATINDYQNFVIGDFNSDGRLDIVKLSGSGQYSENGGSTSPGFTCNPYACEFQLLLGNGDGSFATATSAVPVLPYIGQSPSNLRAVDVNADGIPDLVFGSKPVTASYDSEHGRRTMLVSFKAGYYAGRADGNFEVDVISTDPATGQVTVGGLRPECSGNEFQGDFNGDGLPDSVCEDHNGITLHTWTGVHYIAEQLAWGWSSERWIRGAFDVNGDGKTDLFSGWSFFTIDGQYLGPFSPAYEYTSYRAGNFTGKGGMELLVSYGSYGLYAKDDPLPADTLLSVTEPSGAVTTLTYEGLAGTSRHASDRGTSYASAYPLQEPTTRAAEVIGPSKMSTYRVVDTVPPSFVVTRITADTGVGTAKATTELAYRGYKSDLLGRGSLGFREIRRQTDAPDGSSKLTSVQQRLQAYPYTGAVSVNESYLGALSPIGEAQGGVRLSRTENTYCDMRAAAGAETTATVTAPCPVTSKVQRPYVRRAVQSAWDLNATALPVTTTTSTYSGGYPTLIEKITVGGGPAGSQTFTSRTTNEYWPDNLSSDKWLLGLLKKTSTQSIVPNSLAATTTSAGSAPKATATAGP